MSSTSSSKLPQWDLAYLDNLGYSSLNELMRAIILRCVDDFHSKEEFKKEAIQYMMDQDEEYIFSFRSICHHLGLNPDKTREAIMYSNQKISTRRRSA